jgi:hypothetical protein
MEDRGNGDNPARRRDRDAALSVGRIEQSIALVLIMLGISVITLLGFKRLGGRGYLW